MNSAAASTAALVGLNGALGGDRAVGNGGSNGWHPRPESTKKQPSPHPLGPPAQGKRSSPG